jgi:peroxiredoxin
MVQAAAVLLPSPMTGTPASPIRDKRAARIAFWIGVGLLAASLIFAAAVKIDQALPPHFALPSPEGETIRLATTRGHVVVLNFWASWCLPCADEMPALEKFYQAHREQGVMVIGINVGESADNARAFAHKVGVTFPIALDADASIATRYGARGLPMTVMIDRAGFIRWSYLGQVSLALLEQQLPSRP